MIVFALVYVAGMFFLLRTLDRRMADATAVREAVFLHEERQRRSGWRA